MQRNRALVLLLLHNWPALRQPALGLLQLLLMNRNLCQPVERVDVYLLPACLPSRLQDLIIKRFCPV
jgi:hypothetical protein